MIRPEFIFSFLFLLFAGFSLGADPKCVWKSEKGKKYDLNPLERASDYSLKFYIDSWDYTALINFCGPIVTTICGPGNAGCQTWGGMIKFQVSMGMANSMVLKENTKGDGVVVSYSGGMEGRQFDVDLICDPNGQNPINFLHFSMKTKHACPISGGGGMSLGSVLLLIFFISIFVYFVAGILVKKYALKTEGGFLELIPQKDFWIGFPSLVKSGVMFTISKVRGGGYTQLK